MINFVPSEKENLETRVNPQFDFVAGLVGGTIFGILHNHPIENYFGSLIDLVGATTILTPLVYGLDKLIYSCSEVKGGKSLKESAKYSFKFSVGFVLSGLIIDFLKYKF